MSGFRRTYNEFLPIMRAKEQSTTCTTLTFRIDYNVLCATTVLGEAIKRRFPFKTIETRTMSSRVQLSRALPEGLKFEGLARLLGVSKRFWQMAKLTDNRRREWWTAAFELPNVRSVITLAVLLRAGEYLMWAKCRAD